MSSAAGSAGDGALVLRRVLAGVDGSPDAARALVWAVALCRLAGAELVAVHATGLLETVHRHGVDAEAVRARVERAFERWCKPARASGVRLRLRLEYGSPVPVLLHVVAEEKVDLVVVGSRGEGKVAPGFLGSTSHDLAAHLRSVPIVIVPGATARAKPR